MAGCALPAACGPARATWGTEDPAYKGFCLTRLDHNIILADGNDSSCRVRKYGGRNPLGENGDSPEEYLGDLFPQVVANSHRFSRNTPPVFIGTVEGATSTGEGGETDSYKAATCDLLKGEYLRSQSPTSKNIIV